MNFFVNIANSSKKNDKIISLTQVDRAVDRKKEGKEKANTHDRRSLAAQVVCNLLVWAQINLSS